MAQPVFVANLLMSVAALAAAVYDAYPDRERLGFLATAVPYGVLLEQLVILRFDRYEYPAREFLLTVADVPVVIGFGWAAIIYAGFRTATLFDVSTGRRPLFVGLFALHVDVAIDVVAIRVGFWTWTPPGVWFGVPLGNFLGWFLVATLFSGAWLLLSDRIDRTVIRGPLAAVIAVTGLIVLLQLWEWYATTLLRETVILGGMLAVSAFLVAADRPTPVALPWPVSAVPFCYHVFYWILLVGLGIAATRPIFLVTSGLMLSITLLLHRPPTMVTAPSSSSKSRP